MACKLHKVRYYNPKPESIQCVAFNKSSKLIALARSNASIEIWDLKFAPYLIKFIPGTEDASIEALGWVNNRLLSTGLSGALIEWDIEKLSIRYNIILTGYAAWCLDINPTNTLAAVGTEQGYINLYSVENDEIVYHKLFDKQEGRIMCCKFDHTGNVLVTGSTDTIRVWNVETGHATCRMSVKRRGMETIVWCLAVLSDNVIVSGDSHGRLTFWDSVLGDQIESHPTHKSDILSLVVSDDETSLYCSGIDPVIVSFKKLDKSDLKDKNLAILWVKHLQRNIHEHDVRALVVHNGQLISVGADGYLTFSSYQPKWVMRIPPLIPQPRSAVSKQKKLLLLRYSNYLEVWKLGSYGTDDSGDALLSNVNRKCPSNKTVNVLEQDSDVITINNELETKKRNLKVTENPQKLVTINTKKNKQILCCDMAPNGEVIVYSTDTHMRILKLVCDEDISVTTVLVSGIKRCSHVAFTSDSSTLVAHDAGVIHVLHVDPDAAATMVQNIPLDKYLKSTSLIQLVVSDEVPSKAVYLVAASAEGDVVVWRRESKKFEFHVSLPKYHCTPSAMTFLTEEESLIVVYVDQKIVEYDLVNKVIGKWSSEELPRQWRQRRAAVEAVSPRRAGLLLRDNLGLWRLERQPEEDVEPAVKKNPGNRNNGGSKVNMKVIPFKYLVGFHWLAEDEAVAIETLPENIVSQLPPVFITKRQNRE